MQAIMYDRPRSFRLTTEADQPLQAGQVRLRVLASGICGTDQHIHDGGFGVQFPVTPGHEMIGEIIEHGPDTGRLPLGERVAVDNVYTCGYCPQCQDGRPGLCANLQALGLTHPGSAAEHVIVTESKCVSVGNLDLDTAILAEPTACVVHGLDVLQLKPGSDVLIVGAGPTGQILSQLIARGGASRVALAAPTQFKLDVAHRHGANQTVLTNRADFAASVPTLRELAPHGFDVVIDATGASQVLQQALPLTRTGGTVMVYGMAAEDAQIAVNPYDIFRRELTIKGSFSQTNCVARAVKLLQAGQLRTDGILTHRFPLAEYGDALHALRDPACLKAIVVPDLPQRATT
ncbi:MAG: zinc-dependent alcohol dehydrogenase family protein [Pseudonocardiales bacterium]